MNKSESIFAGLVILAVAGWKSTAIGTAVLAVSSAVPAGGVA
jgi:hypothetical protein